MPKYTICNENFNISEINDEGTSCNQEQTNSSRDQSDKLRNIQGCLSPDPNPSEMKDLKSLTFPVLTEIPPFVNSDYSTQKKFYVGPLRMDYSFYPAGNWITINQPPLESTAVGTSEESQLDKGSYNLVPVKRLVLLNKSTATSRSGLVKQTKDASNLVFLCPKHMHKMAAMQSNRTVSRMYKKYEEPNVEIKDSAKPAIPVTIKNPLPKNFVCRNKDLDAVQSREQKNTDLQIVKPSSKHRTSANVQHKHIAKSNIHESEYSSDSKKDAYYSENNAPKHYSCSAGTQVSMMNRLGPILKIRKSKELVDNSPSAATHMHDNDRLKEPLYNDYNDNASSRTPSNSRNTVPRSIPIFKMMPPMMSIMRKTYGLSNENEVPKHPMKPKTEPPTIRKSSGTINYNDYDDEDYFFKFSNDALKKDISNYVVDEEYHGGSTQVSKRATSESTIYSKKPNNSSSVVVEYDGSPVTSKSSLKTDISGKRVCIPPVFRDSVPKCSNHRKINCENSLCKAKSTYLLKRHKYYEAIIDQVHYIKNRIKTLNFTLRDVEHLFNLIEIANEDLTSNPVDQKNRMLAKKNSLRREGFQKKVKTNQVPAQLTLETIKELEELFDKVLMNIEICEEKFQVQSEKGNNDKRRLLK